MMIHLYRRVFNLLLGTFLFSLGIVISMRADLGFAPWEVFHWGLGKTIGMTIGNASIVISVLICGIVMLLGEKLGLGTFVNMVLMGFMIDGLWALNFIPRMNGLASRLVLLMVGLFVIAFGSYFYIYSGFGAGPRDSLMVALKRKINLPIGLCRGILEFLVVLTGWMLGGPVGIGTLIAAFGISFCIQIVFSLMRFESTAVKHETIDATIRNVKTLFGPREGSGVLEDNAEHYSEKQG